MTVQVGFAEFDALAAPYGVNVGWAEFDALGAAYQVCVGWAELDCLSPSADPVPPFRPGGGVRRYHSEHKRNYEVPVDPVDEAEEEDIILRVLMEIAKHEL